MILVVANLRVDRIDVLLGNRDGTLRRHGRDRIGACPNGNLCARSVAVVDFNGGGTPDLAVTKETSNTVGVLMNTGGSIVKATSSANPSKFGQQVTFTTTVTESVGSGRTPTGMVTIKDGRTTLGTARLLNGQASLTTSSLTVEDHTIGPAYSGNTSFNHNTAVPITQTVVP